jgi:hypothetical protein
MQDRRNKGVEGDLLESASRLSFSLNVSSPEWTGNKPLSDPTVAMACVR